MKEIERDKHTRRKRRRVNEALILTREKRLASKEEEQLNKVWEREEDIYRIRLTHSLLTDMILTPLVNGSHHLVFSFYITVY